MINTTEISSSIIQGNNGIVNMKRIYETAIIADIDNPSNCFRTPFNDFFLKYKNELNHILETVNLEAFWKQRNSNDPKVWNKWEDRYFYKPKTFAYDYYGSIDLWLAVIRANNMKNVYEFHQPIIQVYNRIRIQQLISIFKKREERRK